MQAADKHLPAGAPHGSGPDQASACNALPCTDLASYFQGGYEEAGRQEGKRIVTLARFSDR